MALSDALRPGPALLGPRLRLAIGAAIACLAFLALAQRPLTAPLPDRIEIADLSWVEVRTLIEHGYTTAIVPSGGLEQNGPHLAIGKHDRIVAYTARRIAAGLGHTLVTPVVSFVPQGAYEPPAGHMRFPGTIGVPVPVFAGTLEGIARSLKAAGFRTICFVADHGDSLPAQKAVAAMLSREWGPLGVRVLSVDRYDAEPEQIAFLKGEGETERSIGRHGGIQDTAELMAASPESVRMERWTERPLLSEETGADGDPARATPARGAKLLALKVEAAIAQIRAATGGLALRQTVD